MINITPVILCGGSGARLWPLSRTGFPKEFLCLTGEESLFQQAALRFPAAAQLEAQVQQLGKSGYGVILLKRLLEEALISRSKR
jgi:mannose-1-phosphate guanylyltransferase